MAGRSLAADGTASADQILENSKSRNSGDLVTDLSGAPRDDEDDGHD